MQAILKSETYCGDIPGGRRTSIANCKHVRTTSDHWYGKRDAHPAISSRDVFALAQQRMRENTKRSVRGASGGYLLTGLVTCTTCSAPYIGGGIGGRVRVTPETSDGKSWFYKGSSGVKGPPYPKTCPGPVGTIARNKLDGAIVRTLSRELTKPSMARSIEAEIDRTLTAKFCSGGKELENVRASIKDVERRRDRLVALVADGTLLADRHGVIG